MQVFDKVVQLEPDYAEAYSNRGNALRDLGKLEAAVESYDQAIEFCNKTQELFLQRILYHSFIIHIFPLRSLSLRQYVNIIGFILDDLGPISRNSYEDTFALVFISLSNGVTKCGNGLRSNPNSHRSPGKVTNWISSCMSIGDKISCDICKKPKCYYGY